MGLVERVSGTEFSFTDILCTHITFCANEISNFAFGIYHGNLNDGSNMVIAALLVHNDKYTLKLDGINDSSVWETDSKHFWPL